MGSPPEGETRKWKDIIIIIIKTLLYRIYNSRTENYRIRVLTKKVYMPS